MFFLNRIQKIAKIYNRSCENIGNWWKGQNNKTQVKIECGSKLYTTGNRNKPENMTTPRQTIQSAKRHADEEQSLSNVVVKKHKLEKNNDQSNGIKDNKIK